ncbi:hypothetical protein [Microvirga calopogonii]|uniref:hypothetical protein n=1 Tax=Microvirga calopogonii TaxID=2078013 RepID=UPI000E0CEC39|nr:hypothetical protein [Microvirga calopogonii]
MNRVFLAIGALAFSALLIPSAAEAQRGGHGGFGGGGFGGGGMRMGGFGGAGGFRGGSFGGGGPRMFIPPGGAGGFRAGGFRGGGVGPLTTGSIAVARPGRSDFGMAGIGRPGLGYGVRGPYYRGVAGAYGPYNRGYYGRYPYYGRYGYGYGRYPYYGYYRGYPYYGGALAAGLALGALSYPYYDYGYYGYNYPYYGYYPNYYQTVVASGQDCYWIRRRIVGRNGNVFFRREQVCNY